MTLYVDTFHRPTLGTTAPNGAPWEGTGNWTIDADQLVPTTVTDSQLVADTGANDTDISLVIGENNANHDVGILARWASTTDFVALSLRPDVQQVILYRRSGGFSLISAWTSVAGSADPTGKTLRLRIVGNDFTAFFDGVELGSATSSANSGQTRVGIWSYNTAIHFDQFSFTDAAVAPTGDLDTGALRLVGADLGHVAAPTIPPFDSAPVDLIDDFTRSLINPPPFDRTYRVVGDVDITDNHAAPSAGAFYLPVTQRFLQAWVHVIDHGGGWSGLRVLWSDASGGIELRARVALGANLVQIAALHDGIEEVLGTWTPAAPLNNATLGLDVGFGTIDVTYQGAVLGTVPYTLEMIGGNDVGLFGDTDVLLDDFHVHYVPVAPLADAIHVGLYRAPAPLHIGLHDAAPVAPARTFTMAPAMRGPVAYGPRVRRPGEVFPPIMAKVFRLRNWHTPVAVLDQSFDRTWQEQVGEAGSGSVSLMNDDPDLALIRDGDVIRFELYGEAAFSFVVTDRNRVSIAQGEEHDEITTLSGPGLLAWITQSMLIYPARQPAPDLAPTATRVIQGEPVEEDRTFSWASRENLAEGISYTGAVLAGPMPDPPPEDWPGGVYINRIWAPEAPGAQTVYFRRSFATDLPAIDIYIHTPLADSVKGWLDGELVLDDPGGPDSTEVHVLSGELSSVGTDQHLLCLQIDHVGPDDGSVGIMGFGVNDDGDLIAGGIVTSDVTTGWSVRAGSPPPVTAAGVLRQVLAEMNERRYNPQLGSRSGPARIEGGGVYFDTDYDGNPWPLVPAVTTKVGNTVWAFIQEMAADIEVWMGHDPQIIYLYVAGKRGAERDVILRRVQDPFDPNSGNLAGLTHRRVT